eukprot:Pompholyxophrys_sp_v1_NODE_31_length_3649_cov_4.542571.p2 type:complete len:183 gc:universal NODE_31_length_3649_cov_4.542571:686-138(-)
MTIINFKVAHVVNEYNFGQPCLTFVKNLKIYNFQDKSTPDGLLDACMQVAREILSNDKLMKLQISPSLLISVGKRARLNSTTWISKSYERFRKRINYCVAYKDNGNVFIGLIHYFICVSDAMYACIQRLNVISAPFQRPNLQMYTSIPPTSIFELCEVPVCHILRVMMYIHIPPYVYLLQKL